MHANDQVPAEVRAIIALFKRELAQVSFPEVDAGSLDREVADALAAAGHVERAREALAVAQAVAEARLTALTQSARRAVAYARIYADAHVDRAALRDAIAALGTGPAVVAAAAIAPAAKRRGRPPKPGAELFDARDPACPDLGHAAASRRDEN